MFIRKIMDIDGELIFYIEENDDKFKILFLYGFVFFSHVV